MRISQWPITSISGIFAADMTAPDSDPLDVPGRLRLLRLALGYTQTGLAGLLKNGMTAQKWNNYERGRDRIPVDVAIRLCAVTGANLDYIYRDLMGGLPSDLIKKIEKVLENEAEPAPKKAAGQS